MFALASLRDDVLRPVSLLDQAPSCLAGPLSHPTLLHRRVSELVPNILGGRAKTKGWDAVLERLLFLFQVCK